MVEAVLDWEKGSSFPKASRKGRHSANLAAAVVDPSAVVAVDPSAAVVDPSAVVAVDPSAAVAVDPSAAVAVL